MLKVRSIQDDGTERRLFVIQLEGEPAPSERLVLVARIADRLLEENELPGGFVSEGNGVLALVLTASSRSFFHDGIVFAALDAVNDPVKNPTLTRLDFELPPLSDRRETPDR